MDKQEKDKNEILGALSWNNLEVIRFRDGLIRTTPRKTIKLCFDIIEECNLNCAGCLVFSPLVCDNGYVMTISSFEKDVERLSEIFDEDEIDVITISGGEPLLHKEVEKFPQIIRKYFGKVNIRIVTNGLLLLNQPDSFGIVAGKIKWFWSKPNIQLIWILKNCKIDRRKGCKTYLYG